MLALSICNESMGVLKYRGDLLSVICIEDNVTFPFALTVSTSSQSYVDEVVESALVISKYQWLRYGVLHRKNSSPPNAALLSEVMQ